MNATPVCSLAGKFQTEYLSDLNCMRDSWTSLAISVDEFSTTIITHCVPFARSHKASAWIVDSSQATGVFPQDLQTYFSETVFPTLAKAGLKYFITISPPTAISGMSLKSCSRKASSHGLQIMEAGSLEAAYKFLRDEKLKAA